MMMLPANLAFAMVGTTPIDRLLFVFVLSIIGFRKSHETKPSLIIFYFYFGN